MIGGGVVGEGAVAHRQRAAGRLTSLDDAEVENAAAIESGVAGESAVAHHRRPESLVVEAAAAEAGGVAGEGAAAHRQRPTEVVDAAAVGDGGVAGGGTVDGCDDVACCGVVD